MGNIKFIKTDDGSTGLYDEDVKDIYHSKTGALKEAYDKFILPSGIKKLAEKNESLSILDVCYGIGYNTKAALNSVSRSIKINIDCLENNIELINISPFIIDKIDNADLKIKLFEEILNINSNSPEFVINNLKKYLNLNINFFAPSLMLFIEHLISEGYIYSGQDINRSFLHNIYYSYISNKINNAENTNKYSDTKITFHVGEARKKIQDINKYFDVIFLDGFSPQKDPRLWTIDFLNLLKQKMKNNSVLVSYSKSTPFRSALLQLGFCVGKTFIDNIDMGTIASFNNECIKNKLNDYDLKLISTRSGIVYKDKNLSGSVSSIINMRNDEIKNSDRMSHTQFLKEML